MSVDDFINVSKLLFIADTLVIITLGSITYQHPSNKTIIPTMVYVVISIIMTWMIWRLIEAYKEVSYNSIVYVVESLIACIPWVLIADSHVTYTWLIVFLISKVIGNIARIISMLGYASLNTQRE